MQAILLGQAWLLWLRLLLKDEALIPMNSKIGQMVLLQSGISTQRRMVFADAR